ncbi:hypothetical protein C0992_012270 [Termitomyces sp. T32_za158]|nr:hypothetical protein C0992_012270 [Termitomyces sp. T32_za158]
MLSQFMAAPYPPVLELRPSTVISGLAPSSYTIIAVASARIYHAQLAAKTPEWCYSRMRGTLVFGKDTQAGERPGQRPPAPIEAGSYWFRLLDSTSGKPIWMFKILAGFVYELDRPFFHVFQGKEQMVVTGFQSRRFGFLFEDDDEAGILAKKPSMISLPAANSFVHVAHVGLNKDGIIEATAGIDPSWRAILEGYGPYGFDEPIKVPERKISFGDAFWRKRERDGNHSRAASTTELSEHRS